jgi:hypothetical protein
MRPSRRRLLGVLALGLLVATSGCTGLFGGGGGVSDKRLDKAPSGDYEWNETEYDVTIWVEGGTFKAIYDLNDTTTIKFYRDNIQQTKPLKIRAVRYQYPNGTVVNGSDLDVRTKNGKTWVTVPDGDGKLAITAGASPKSFGLPVQMKGSHEVVLPKGTRSNFILFGQVNPGRYERFVEDGRQHVVWERDIGGRISIRYYLQRDLYIFAGIVAVFGLAGVGIVAYYRRKIRALRERREEHGLDLDVDDEFDDEPPPGMG